jgi:signal transduction histidine kinase
VPTLINRGDGEPENSGLVPLGHVERRSRSLMFAPIRWDGETIGVVTVQSYTDHRYAERDLSLLQTLADHCGGCLARLQAEQELLSQQVRNIRLDRLRWLGEMATDIAHVLNQPLQGVRGLAEHLLMGMDRGWEVTGEKVREKLGIIMAQADRMDYFIQHLRDLAQDSGRSVRYLTAPNQVLKAAAELFTSRGIRVHLHLATDLPSIHVNPRALEEAVVHLLSNAREATEERYGTRTRSEQTQITLRSSSMEVDGAAWVLIEVVDQGTGIPADLQVRIFEPFFTTKIPGHGTGLGLSVVKVIAEEYGGHVGVESEAGLGTTVRISLPASRR